MNKKLLALAVAAVIAAPMAAVADTSVYGKVHLSVDKYNDTNNDGWTVKSRASRLGFKGSEDLGGGLKAIWKMEFQVDMASAGGASDPISSRNMYIGLNGGWGSLLLGRHDTPYKMSTGKLDMFADTIGDYNKSAGFDDIRANTMIAYVSPKMAGFKVAAAVVAPNSNTDINGISEAQSIALMWNGGAFNAAVAYEGFDSDFAAAAGKAESKYRIGLGANFGAFTANAIYEDQSDIAAVSGADKTIWQVQGRFKFGNNAVKAYYGNNDTDGGSDRDGYGVGFDHDFSKRTRAYVIWADHDDATSQGLSMGMIHKF